MASNSLAPTGPPGPDRPAGPSKRGCSDVSNTDAGCAEPPTKQAVRGLENHDVESKEGKPFVELRELLGPDVEFVGFRCEPTGANPAGVVMMDVNIGELTVTIQLPDPSNYFDEDDTKKLPADMAVFAKLGAELHGLSLGDWLRVVRNTVAELKQRVHQDCRNVVAIVLVFACFDTLITCERLHDLLDLYDWVSFDEDNSRPDYPLFPPTILTALVCVGIVCNNTLLLAHTLVVADTKYATERLPKLAAAVLYAIVIDGLITRDMALKLIAELEDTDDDAKHSFNLANLAKVVRL